MGAAPFQFRHFPQLDGLRGVSILLVLLGHALHYSLHMGSPWGNLAGLGVMLFFVLSGFLITGLLCQEEQKQGRINIVHFYINRALRIFPAFYFFIGVAAVLMLLQWITDVPWYAVGVCLMYLRNIFGRGDSLVHLWSLSLEEQFYAIWPWVVWRVRCSRLLGWAVAMVAVITAWRTIGIILGLWSYEAGRFYVRPDFRFDSILIGCCVALFFFRYGRQIPLGHLLSRICHPVLLYPALVAWTLLMERHVWARPFYLTVQMVLSAGVLYRLIYVDHGFLCRLFSQAWLRYIGRLSYSIYLWQQIFIVTKIPDWGWIRTFPCDIVACCAAGMLSHYCVEKPFLNLKERLRRQRQQTAGITKTTPAPVSMENGA